jgi:catechol 2,3-dioxygenase-like lactoylglutathione lyase family enzyme
LQLHVIVNDDQPARPMDRHRIDVRDPHFALWVDDADALCARLQASGQPFYDYVSTPTGLRQLFIHDHDGNMVEFLGPTREPRTRRMEEAS